MKKVVKPSDILRKAASIINSDLRKAREARTGCCDALERADAVLTGNKYELSAAYESAYEYFRSLFKPTEHKLFWFGDKGDLYWNFDARKQVQEHRIIALLMTADMAESVGQ